MSELDKLSIEDLEAYDKQLVGAVAEQLPQKGDKLFVASDRAARLDPLGYSDPFEPEERSLIGRRALYSDGYLTAGDRLTDSIREAPDDALIYPILFLYRHHLELELKDLISYSLNHLSGMDEAAIEKKIKDLEAVHSLKSLWYSVNARYPDCNKEVSAECRNAFQSLLFELDEQDPNSQAARYTTDRAGNATLAHLAFVDLPTFKTGIHKISKYLRAIYENMGQEIVWRDEMASW